MGGRGGGACGSTRRDGEIVREKLHSFGDAFYACTWNVDAVTSVVVRGGSEVPPINNMGGPGAAFARGFMENESGAGRC